VCLLQASRERKMEKLYENFVPWMERVLSTSNA
jgi:hypothetical protein